MKIALLTLASATLLASFALGACKSDDAGTDGADDAGATDAARAACTEAYESLQAFYDRCYPGSSSSDVTDLRDYRTRAIDACAITVSLPGNSPSLVDAYQACGKAVKGADCTADTDDLCEAIGDSKGTRKAGDACESDSQCDTGDCAFPARSAGDGGDYVDTAADRCGTCARAVAVGADCKDDTVTCGDGASCNYSSTSTNGEQTATCKADDKVGDACESYCTGDDLTCIGGTCKARPGKGEACDGQCASGLRCMAEICKAPLEEGATCDPEEDACGAVFECDADTKKCTRQVAPTAKIGQACNDSEAATRCAEGFCFGAEYDPETQEQKPGTCRAYAKVGEACENGSSSQANGEIYCEPYLECLGKKCEEPARRCTY